MGKISTRLPQLVLFSGIVTLVLGCSPADQVSTTEYSYLTPSQFVQSGDWFAGHTIRVRGYLVVRGRLLAIYGEELYDQDFSRNDYVQNRTMIFDRSPEAERVLNEIYSTTKDCTNRFVEIVGDVAMIDALNTYGIVRIRTIEVFNESDFSESAGFCFGGPAR